MSITFNDYIIALKSGKYQPIAKVEWLRSEDESVYSEFTADILDGNLTVNKQNGVRRSVNITLKNTNATYIPNPDRFWINQKFKLYLGLRINDEDFLLPQGVFVLANPEVVSEFSRTVTSISGIDKFALLDGQLGGELDGIYQIPVGFNINNTIRSILILVKDRKTPVLQSTIIGTPYTIIHEYGSTYGSIILELSGLLSRNCYYDADGHFIFEDDVLDITKGSQWDFTTEEFLYLGGRQEYNFVNIFNKILVIGDNINGDIATGVAINDNLLSDTRIQLIGTRIKVIQDNIISTGALALNRAIYELRKYIAIHSSVKITSIPMYHLTADSVITLTDSSLNLNKERFVIQGFSLPLTIGGKMSITAVKAQEFGID